MICADVVLVGGVQTLAVSGNAACSAGQLVILDQVDYQQLLNSPFSMSVTDGGAVASAVLLVWALGFGVRALIRVVRHTDDGPSGSAE